MYEYSHPLPFYHHYISIRKTRTLLYNVLYNTNAFNIAVIDDFKLLETMNKVTTERYAEMTNTAAGLVNYMKELQEKCKDSICFNCYDP